MLTILLAIITGLCGIWAGYYQYLDKKDSDKIAEEAKEEAKANQLKADQYHGELKEAQDKLLLIAHTTNEAALELADVYKQLAEANSKLANISELTYKNVTGGGNVPRMEIQFSGSTPQSYYLVFRMLNSGDIDLRNVKVKIHDNYSNILPGSIVYDPDSTDSFSCSLKNLPDYNFEKTIIGDLPQDFSNEVHCGELPRQIINFNYFVNVVWQAGFYSFILIGNNNYDDAKFPDLELTFQDNIIDNEVTIKKANISPCIIIKN